MIGALRARVEKLAFGFPLKDNYFAWQAFGRSYAKGADAPLPPYLQEANFEKVRSGVDRVQVLHASMTTHLASLPAASADCYVLLDAQDWMTPQELTAVWTAITHAAKPGARVIFRTAGSHSPVDACLTGPLANVWTRDHQTSDLLGPQDRSGIYGALHLYRLNPR
jgi:S-adenosylmethionine-diacylglycerol 3-amino-3-carboxypropyl transferase